MLICRGCARGVSLRTVWSAPALSGGVVASRHRRPSRVSLPRPKTNPKPRKAARRLRRAAGAPPASRAVLLGAAATIHAAAARRRRRGRSNRRPRTAQSGAKAHRRIARAARAGAPSSARSRSPRAFVAAPFLSPARARRAAVTSAGEGGVVEKEREREREIERKSETPEAVRSGVRVSKQSRPRPDRSDPRRSSGLSLSGCSSALSDPHSTQRRGSAATRSNPRHAIYCPRWPRRADDDAARPRSRRRRPRRARTPFAHHPPRPPCGRAKRPHPLFCNVVDY